MAKTPRIIDPENQVRKEIMKYFLAFEQGKVDLIEAVKGVMKLIRCPKEYEHNKTIWKSHKQMNWKPGSKKR